MTALASPNQSIQMCGCVWSEGITMFLMRTLMETGLLVGMERKLNQSSPFWTAMASGHLVMRAGVISSTQILECIFMAQVILLRKA
eukprot:888838-Karenia_brevis.AAC.1